MWYTGQLLGRKNRLPQSISKAKVEKLSITTVASNPDRKLRTPERLKKITCQKQERRLSELRSCVVKIPRDSKMCLD